MKIQTGLDVSYLKLGEQREQQCCPDQRLAEPMLLMFGVVECNWTLCCSSWRCIRKFYFLIFFPFSLGFVLLTKLIK